jgi:hypothetical protein
MAAIIVEWRLNRIIVIPGGNIIGKNIISDEIGVLCVEEFYIVDDIESIKMMCRNNNYEVYDNDPYTIGFRKRLQGILTFNSREVFGIQIQTVEQLNKLLSETTVKRLGINPKVGDNVIYHYYLSGHIFRKWYRILEKMLS